MCKVPSLLYKMSLLLDELGVRLSSSLSAKPVMDS